MPVTAEFDDALTTALLPAAVRERYPEPWHALGQGLFSWSVFRVYRAVLHVQGTGFDPDARFALDLNYLRRVSAEQIAQTSVQEMQRLVGVEPQTAVGWGEKLQKILPDVQLGDRLIGVFDPGVGVTFFAGERELGTINDIGFLGAFAAVWLHADTRAPLLRAQLLGLETA